MLYYVTSVAAVVVQDVGANAKQFAHKSGKYGVELIVGDAVIQNPFSWNLVRYRRHSPFPYE